MTGILTLVLILSDAALAGGLPRVEYVPPSDADNASSRRANGNGALSDANRPEPHSPPSVEQEADSAAPAPGESKAQQPGPDPSPSEDNGEPDPPIKPFTQTFRFTTSGWPFGIGAERTLAPAGDGTWMMQLKASNWLGEIRETTRFRWRGCLPQTLSWEYQRSGLGQDRRASIVVDPETQTVEVNEKDKPSQSYSLSGPATDKVSQVLALQCMLKHGERPLQFPVADEDGVEQVRYVIRGEERIKTPAGRIKALRLEQVREQDTGRSTLLWFAPERDHALVRLLQREGGDQHQLIIQD